MAVEVRIHCHIGIVQRTRRQSAGQRLAYQMASTFEDNTFGVFDYSKRRREHCGTMIVLPDHAPEWMYDRKLFRLALTAPDPRIDGQEGVSLDIGLPRQIAPEYRLAVAAFALKSLVEMGVAGQIDVHTSRASDDETNPHFHALLSQREINHIGFANKNRDWAQFFRKEKGQHVRALIAARITHAAQLLGHDIRIDPRSAEAKGDLQPEARVGRNTWVELRSGKQQPIVTKLNALRKIRRNQRKALAILVDEKQRVIDVISLHNRAELEACWIAPAYSEILEDKNNALDRFVVAAQRLATDALTGAVFNSSHGFETIEWLGANLRFDGERLVLSGRRTRHVIRLLVELAVHMDWPALVTHGDTAFKNALAYAAASHEETPMVLSDGEYPGTFERLRKLGPANLYRMVAQIDGCDMLGEAVTELTPFIFERAPRPEDRYGPRQTPAQSNATQRERAPLTHLNDDQIPFQQIVAQYRTMA